MKRKRKIHKNEAKLNIHSKFILDQADQMDLEEYIKYDILNFTNKELERISEKEAEKLDITAKGF